MKKMTDEFFVITDDGERIKVVEYTNFIDAGTFENPKATVPGLKEYRTSDGKAVNFLEEGIYRIVPLNINARKTSI